MQGTLFTTKPVYHKNDAPILHVHFEIRNAKEFEASLAILLLRDLCSSKVSLGGEKCIGRGTSKGISAKINYNGEIELETEALTPLFFGGNGEKSFAPVGTLIISGRSLRDMFKNIFKIITCETFRGRTDSQKKGEDFNDEHIYYRCLMEVRSLPLIRDLNREYNFRMVGTIQTKKIPSIFTTGFFIFSDS